MFLAVKAPTPVTAAELRLWRATRIDPATGKAMRRDQAATYFGIGERTYRRYEEDDCVPGWLARFVRQDHVPTGFHRKGGVR